MIPHHSMAILMSQKIKEKTENKELSKFANSIITTQLKEISDMRENLQGKPTVSPI